MAQHRTLEPQLDVIAQQLNGLLETSERDLPLDFPTTLWSGLKEQRELLTRELQSRTTPGIPLADVTEADKLQSQIQEQKTEEAGVKAARLERIAALRDKEATLVLDLQQISISKTAKDIDDKVKTHTFEVLTEDMDPPEKVGCFARFFCCCLPRVRNLEKLKTRTQKIEATLGHLSDSKLQETAKAKVELKLREIRAELSVLEETAPKTTADTVFTPPVRRAVRLRADLESLAIANENSINKAITICLVKIRYLIKQILDYFAKQATLASPTKKTRKSSAKTTAATTHPVQDKAQKTLAKIEDGGETLHTTGGVYSATLNTFFNTMDGLKENDQRNVYQSDPKSAYIAGTLISEGVFDATVTPIPPTHPRPAVPGSRPA